MILSSFGFTGFDFMDDILLYIYTFIFLWVICAKMLKYEYYSKATALEVDALITLYRPDLTLRFISYKKFVTRMFLI
jgi:hypothetical protein